MTHRQLKALKLLAQHETASVANAATRVNDAALSIHARTAMALIRGGFAMHSENTLTITPKGMRRVGRVTETDGERRRRQAAEALAAQRQGEWQPAPAGTAAAADRAAADDRRHIAELIEEINTNKEQASFERRMMELAKSWDDSASAEECRRDAERYEAIAREKEEELDDFGRSRARAA
jgi:hypothetical protein